jgi:hypothetical protein
MSDNNHKILALSLFLGIGALSVVCLRLYVRGVLIGRLGADDWAAVAAFVSLCKYVTCAITLLTATKFCILPTLVVQCVADISYAASGSISITQEQMRIGSMVNSLLPIFFVLSSKNKQLLVVYGTVYPIAVSATRISVLLFYRQLTHQANAFVHRLCTVFLVITPFYMLGLVLPLFLFCRPIDAMWSVDASKQKQCAGELQHGKALEKYTFSVILLNIVADLVLCLLPIQMIWRTQMSLRTKLGVVTLLGLGFL